MQNYPAAYTTAQDVAQKIYTAATDETQTLRYPAGADSEMFAQLKRTTSEDEFLERMREMFGAK